MAGLESAVRGSSLKRKPPRGSSPGVSECLPYCHNFEAEQAGALKSLCITKDLINVSYYLGFTSFHWKSRLSWADHDEAVFPRPSLINERPAFTSFQKIIEQIRQVKKAQFTIHKFELLPAKLHSILYFDYTVSAATKAVLVEEATAEREKMSSVMDSVMF